MTTIRRSAEALTPGLVLVLGLQAVRAAGVSAAAAWAELGAWPRLALLALSLAVFLVVPLAGRLAVGLGRRRTAAALAATLAAARLLAQVAGTETALVYGVVGVALLAAYLSLWSVAAPSPRTALHAIMLGFSLHLADRILTDTYDLVWQQGRVGPLVVVVLLCALLIASALVQLFGHQPTPAPSREAAPLGLPFVVVALQLAVAHPVRLAALQGWRLPETFLILALAQLVGLVLALLADHQLARLLAQRTPNRGGWRAYQALRGVLTGLLVVGVLFAETGWGMLIATAGPTALGVNLSALLRSRPVGRRRRVGDWALLAAWGLAALLTLAADTMLWPVALAVGLVYGLAGVALFHPDRPAEEPEPPIGWPLHLHTALAVLALVTALRPPDSGQPGPSLQPGELRLAAVSLAGLQPTELASTRRFLVGIEPDLVLLDDPRRGHGMRFVDAGYWLAARLRLAADAPSHTGATLFLAAHRALAADRVAPGVAAAAWRLNGSFLAVGSVTAPDATASDVAAAAALVDAFPRGLVVAGHDAPALEPPGFERVPARGSGAYLLAGRGIEVRRIAASERAGRLVADVEIGPVRD